MAKHYVDTNACAEHGEACFHVKADLGTGPKELHICYAIFDCPEHGESCTVIITPHNGDVLVDLDTIEFDTDRLVVSHAPSSLHPECRLNDTYPKAVDMRGDTPRIVDNVDACEGCDAYLNLKPAPSDQR